MTLKSLALSLVLLLVATVAGADPIVRILCRPEIGEISRLRTLRSDVVETYPSPDISIVTPEGKKFLNIHDYQPWEGNFLNVHTFFIGETRNGEVGLYKVDAHIGRREGQSELLFPSRRLSNSLQTTLFNKGYQMRVMTRNENWLVYPGPRADQFILFDVETEKSRTLNLRKNLLNPRFSVSSDYLIFDEAISGGSTLRQVAYDVKTGKPVFETRSGGNSAYLEYVASRRSWVWAEFSGPRSSVSLVQSKGGQKSVLAKIRGEEIKWPLVYSKNQDGLDVFWAEHSFEVNRDEDTLEDVTTFTKSQVRRLRLGLTTMENETWKYPESLLSKYKLIIPRQMMTEAFKPADTSEIFFSISDIGGLAKLNTETGSWELLGVGVANRCFSPAWSYEGAE